MPPKNKYSDPKLREEVKEDIKQSDKGGEPGQWSARKAQMMAKEYKARGGDYNTPKSSKDESQKNLDKWGEEDWQTKEGSSEAKEDDGSRKRYLPKKAWENMSEKEKETTDKKKLEASKGGQQYVGNTDNAKNARAKASKSNDEQDDEDGSGDDSNGDSDVNEDSGKEYDESQDDDQDNRQTKSAKEKSKSSKQNQNQSKPKSNPETNSKVSNKDEESDSDSSTSQKENKTPSQGQKQSRKRTHQQTDEDHDGKDVKKSKTSEDKKTVGSKHDKASPPAKQGSTSRLPSKGQKNVHWKALPGWVEGEVVDIVQKDKQVDGKKVKASKSDPKVVLKSKSSGKICVHKADNVYFD